ncbi:MAG: hypothetical protein JSR77_00205 [Planctomycetes bacterium]|nr:hypothetical protein [Planctomycetota bacterium]
MLVVLAGLLCALVMGILVRGRPIGVDPFEETTSESVSRSFIIAHYFETAWTRVEARSADGRDGGGGRLEPGYVGLKHVDIKIVARLPDDSWRFPVPFYGNVPFRGKFTTTVVIKDRPGAATSLTAPDRYACGKLPGVDRSWLLRDWVANGERNGVHWYWPGIEAIAICAANFVACVVLAGALLIQAFVVWRRATRLRRGDCEACGTRGIRRGDPCSRCGRVIAGAGAARAGGAVALAAKAR